jgi:hypothetical protein
MSNSVRAIIVFAFAMTLFTIANVATADSIDDFQQSLRTFDTEVLREVKQPVRHAASVSALVVSLQTDLLGNDNVQAPFDIREVSQHTGRVSRQRDNLATAARRVDVFLRSIR